MYVFCMGFAVFLYCSCCSCLSFKRIFFARIRNSLIVWCRELEVYSDCGMVWHGMAMAISNRFCSFSVWFRTKKKVISLWIPCSSRANVFIWGGIFSTYSIILIDENGAHLLYIYTAYSSFPYTYNIMGTWWARAIYVWQTCTPLIYHYRHRRTLSHEFSRVCRTFYKKYVGSFYSFPSQFLSLFVCRFSFFIFFIVVFLHFIFFSSFIL